MSEPVKLPDRDTVQFGVLRERELITRWAQIGPKGEFVRIRYVVSKAVPA